MSAALGIEIAAHSSRWADALPRANALARDAAGEAWKRAGGDSEAELSIVLGDDALLRALNGRYRNQDGATNVLSFAAEDGEISGTPRLLGDVILAYETIAREAREQDKRLADHFQHLCVHGVLHLLGHDHQNDTGAAAMEVLEIAILATLGIADPYRAGALESRE